MKGKVLFFLVLVLYSVMGISSRIRIPYIELNSMEGANGKYLVYIICASILIGIIYLIWFTKVFPKGFYKQTLIGKVGILIAFCCVAFAINTHWLFTLNTWFGKSLGETQFMVTDKFYEETRRTKFYRVNLKEVNSARKYILIVSRKNYNTLWTNDTLVVELYNGPFDILYGKD